jgi:hypothetical protein
MLGRVDGRKFGSGHQPPSTTTEGLVLHRSRLLAQDVELISVTVAR